MLFLFPPTRVLMRRLLIRRGALRLMTSIPGTASAPPGPSRNGRPHDIEGTAVDIDPPPTIAMSVEQEAPRALRKPGDTDAVTFTFADAGAGLYGLARVASGLGGDGAQSSSAAGDSVLRARDAGRGGRGGRDPAAGADGIGGRAARALARGLRRARPGAGVRGVEPGRAAYSKALVKAGGMEGYEQLCRVTGKGSAARAFAGLGERGHAWGNPDWDKIALTRAVGAWFEDGSGVSLALVRAAKAANHADEAAWGAAFGVERSCEIDEVRLSTTTDAERRQFRAGVELWLSHDDDYPHRGQGEALTGSTLELGALRLDCRVLSLAHRGPHRYRPLRRAPARVIAAVVSDFGGVITLPLDEAFRRAHAQRGLPLDALRDAMELLASRAGEPPLFRWSAGS